MSDLLLHRRSGAADRLRRAAELAFLLAALCPFTANYTVAPLAETLSIFFVAAGPRCRRRRVSGVGRRAEVMVGLDMVRRGGFGGILLRPDGGILLIALGLYLLWRMWRQPAERLRLFWAGALVLAISIAPLVPWTIRNWRDFHRFQPLVPQSASDPDEFVPDGFDKLGANLGQRLCFDRRSLLAGSRRQGRSRLLPSRAFDSAQEREQTQALFDDYDKMLVVNPAAERPLHGTGERAHPTKSAALLRLAADAAHLPTCGCVRAPRCCR